MSLVLDINIALALPLSLRNPNPNMALRDDRKVVELEAEAVRIYQDAQAPTRVYH